MRINIVGFSRKRSENLSKMNRIPLYKTLNRYPKKLPLIHERKTYRHLFRISIPLQCRERIKWNYKNITN